MSANGGEIRARLVLSNDEFKRKMNEAREDMKRTGFSAQQMKKDFDVVQKGSLALGAAVVGAIGGSVKIAADFESSMARVKAISGATDEEFARLEKTARDMGAATIFSASEAAEGLSYLAMAGFDVDQQISALPAVLNAAIAGQIGLGQSADIVSNIMTGFGIAADDAGKAVDVLVKASVTANTDLPMLGDGMKYVAPVAASLGWSIEETAAAIGKLSDAGIQGSQSGTVLRAALLALANPTGQTEKAMKRLNIEVLDASGNMKPMPELMGHIASKMEGMTDAQKTQTAAQLVGTQAAAGFIALLEVGEEGLADYVTELENSAGAAQEMADIQENTLVGAFKEFQSAMEEAGIKLGNEFLPEFTKLVRAATDVVNIFDDVNAGQAKSALVFAGTAAAIGLTISTVGKLIIAMRGLMVSMGPAGWLIAGLSIVGGLIAATRVSTEEAIEVNLDHARSLDEQSSSMSTQIERFDALQEKNKLTNKELAEFVDLQTRIKLETDPTKIDEMQERYDALQEKSGMTNEEMNEFLTLNDDILAIVPNSNAVLTEQGNVLLNNTDAAKAYNEQLQKELELELRKQANEASSQLLENIQKRADALVEINRIAEEYIEMQERVANQEMQLATEELKLQKAREEGNEASIKYAEQRVAEEERSLEILEHMEYSLAGQLIEQEQIVNEIELQISKGQEAYQELINYHLKQVEVTAEKGKENEALDAAIEKIRKQQEEVRKKYTEEGKITAEGQKQLDNLDSQITEINNAKTAVNRLKGDQDRLTSAIDDSVGSAVDLNYEMDKDIKKSLDVTGYSESDADNLNKKLGAPITKRVSIFESVKRFFTGETKHGGGVVGDGRSTGVSIPKLHTGGLPANLINRPMHNEIDVRLLRNEMVLTEGQQANLFRMIDLEAPTANNDNRLLTELLNASLKQNHLLSRLLQKDTNLYVDNRQLATIQEPVITELQERNKGIKESFR